MAFQPYAATNHQLKKELLEAKLNCIPVMEIRLLTLDQGMIRDEGPISRPLVTCFDAVATGPSLLLTHRDLGRVELSI